MNKSDNEKSRQDRRQLTFVNSISGRKHLFFANAQEVMETTIGKGDKIYYQNRGEKIRTEYPYLLPGCFL